MRIGNWFSRLFSGRNQFINPFTDGLESQICCELALNIAAMTSERISLPQNYESYGLVETQIFNKNHGDRVDQQTVDRINGVTK
jgi:hypothetical protein